MRHRRIPVPLLLALALGGSGTAAAEPSLVGATAAPLYAIGNFCSLAADGGRWGTLYDPFLTAQDLCARVEYQLLYGATARFSEIGLYRIDGENLVTVDCAGALRIQRRGFGGAPFQDAYQAATALNGQECLFFNE